MRHPKFKSFADASVYAHRYFDVLPHNATNLNRDLKCGSVARWKKFLKARKKFLSLRQQRVPRKKAFEQVYNHYHIRLKPVKQWKTTQGNPVSRRGPVESRVDRKQKTGPKTKFSRDTVKAIFQYADTHNDATNQEIADFVNNRLSQATADVFLEDEDNNHRNIFYKKTLKNFFSNFLFLKNFRKSEFQLF